MATNKNKEQELTFNDVTNAWNQLFSMSSSDPSRAINALGMAYTNNPYIQSQRVKSINSLPVFFKRNEVESALKDMPSNESLLRKNAWAMLSIYPFMKLYYMYSDILSYRYFITSKGVRKEECARKDYIEEHKYVHKLIDKLRPKRTLREIALDTFIEGKSAYCVRLGLDDNDVSKETKLPKVKYFDLQKIPSDFWKITGINSDSKFTVSVNFTLFWQPGYSIEQYPPIFKKYYEKLLGYVDKNGKPIKDISKIGSEYMMQYDDGLYYYWVTMPTDEVFVFSHTESHSWQLPNFSGLFLQAQDLQSYSYLQEELLQLPLSSVIIGTLPMNNPNTKVGASANNFSLSTEAVAFFENLFNSVAPRGVKFMLAPGEGYQHFKFDNSVPNNINIVTETQQQWISSSGTGGLISTTNKPSQAMVKSAQKLEPRYADRLYQQWMNMIDIIIERKIGTKYEWKFHIEGDIFNDEETFNRCKEAISTGNNFIMPKYLSFFDMDMEDAISNQYYVESSGIYDRMRNVESAFNTSSKNGRPLKQENDIDNDNTAISKDAGSNTSDGRVVDFLKTLSADKVERLLELLEEE